MSRHQKKTGPRFIQLFYFMLESKAWKDLNAVERAVYLELTERYNGSNNGRIGYSARTAAANLKIARAPRRGRYAACSSTDLLLSRSAEHFTARSAMPASID